MNRRVVSCLLCYMMLSIGTVATAAAQEAERTAEETRDDLILEQLESLRMELRVLRSELGELRKAVNDIHKVAVRPQAPPAPSSVDLDDDAIMGSPEAKVAIVEFSDFQCPYCLRFHNSTFPELRENYIDTGKVRYSFRDFPLTQIHSKAVEAAVAANCSGAQDKYWEMHHDLFINQRQLGPELYNELAESLQLDMEAFQSCLQDPEQIKEVEQDLAAGQRMGIRGTPHYLIGRIEGNRLVDIKPLSGAQPYQAFAQIIDSLLK